MRPDLIARQISALARSCRFRRFYPRRLRETIAPCTVRPLPETLGVKLLRDCYRRLSASHLVPEGRPCGLASGLTRGGRAVQMCSVRCRAYPGGPVGGEMIDKDANPSLSSDGPMGIEAGANFLGHRSLAQFALQRS